MRLQNTFEAKRISNLFNIVSNLFDGFEWVKMPLQTLNVIVEKHYIWGSIGKNLSYT